MLRLRTIFTTLVKTDSKTLECKDFIGGNEEITNRNAQGVKMIRQHLFNGAKPGSREHLEKYLMEQRHRRSKNQEADIIKLASLAFLAGCVVTVLAMLPL